MTVLPGDDLGMQRWVQPAVCSAGALILLTSDSCPSFPVLEYGWAGDSVSVKEEGSPTGWVLQEPRCPKGDHQEWGFIE